MSLSSSGSGDSQTPSTCYQEDDGVIDAVSQLRVHWSASFEPGQDECGDRDQKWPRMSRKDYRPDRARGGKYLPYYFTALLYPLVDYFRTGH